MPDRSPARPASPLAVLRHRRFRRFWAGYLVSVTGTWMGATGLGWLVLELTDSVTWLGLVSAAQTLPVLLLTLFAGVVADREDKRSILLVTQTAALLLAAALALLVAAGVVRLWHAVLLAALLGTVDAFDIPTRQSFVLDLVPRDDLLGAVAFNSAAFNLGRVIGPALAGLLIAAVGLAPVFGANALSFAAVLLALLSIRRLPFQRPGGRLSTVDRLREGLAYVRRERRARTLLLLLAGFSVLGFPYAVLMPAFARDELRAGPRGLGFLLAAIGVGAVLGAVAVAAFGGRGRPGRVLASAGLLFSGSVLGFSLSRSLNLSLALLALSGFGLVVFSIHINTLLQTLAPDALRGRIMSVYTFVFSGMAPFGSLQVGLLAGWLGPRAAVASGAVACAALLLLVARRYRRATSGVSTSGAGRSPGGGPPQR